MFFNKKKMALCYMVAIFFIVLDRLLKMIAFYNFQGRGMNLFRDFLQFTFVKNYYIALSLPLSGVFLNFIIIILIFLILFYAFVLYKKQEWEIATALTIIGIAAISNIYDRLMYGFVIDYLSIKWFSVFNLADSMIVLGVLSVILLFGGKNGQQTKTA